MSITEFVCFQLVRVRHTESQCTAVFTEPQVPSFQLVRVRHTESSLTPNPSPIGRGW